MKLLDQAPTPFGGTQHLPAVKGRRRRWLWAAVAVPALGAAGVGLTRLPPTSGAPPVSAESPGPAPQAVAVVRPVKQTIRKTIEQPGRVEGYEQTPIQVKIPGFVAAWKADLGQRVTAGELLAELTVPEEKEELVRREASVALAHAEVTAAETTLDAAKADENRAAALVTQANASKARATANVTRWTAEYKRTGDTHARGATSQSDLDIALDQLRTVEAGLKEAEAGIEAAIAAKASATAAKIKADAGVVVAKAKLAVAEADARRQAEWLKYATVRAPFAGVVVQRNVDRGQYVTPPASGSAQVPLFVIVRTDPVRVFVDVPETEAALVRDAMPAAVRIQALGDREIGGTVTHLSWALDANTRTLRVQIDLPNADGVLRPGMFATARFVTERPGAWMVPAKVISTAEEQPFAVRVEGDKGMKTPVKLGARQNGMVELIHKQTRTAPKGEPIVWETLTGTEEFLTTRPAGWSDGTVLSFTR